MDYVLATRPSNSENLQIIKERGVIGAEIEIFLSLPDFQLDSRIKIYLDIHQN